MDTHSPLILIPGFGLSRLAAYKNGDMDYNHIDFWINSTYLARPDILGHIMKLSYNPFSHKTNSTYGYSIVAPGWGSTLPIESLNSNSGKTYFYTLVKHILKTPFYRRFFTLRGAPYDFRMGPKEISKYYFNLKILFENTYHNAGNRKVVLLAHGLGCLHAHYFLKITPTAWKEKYVKSFVSVGGPYGGKVETLLLETNGITYNPKIDPSAFRDMERSFPSSSFLLPNKKYFGNDTLIQTSKRIYTANQYSSLFKDMEYMDGYHMYKDIKDFIDPSEAPTGVNEIYCIYGSVINETVSSISIKDFNDRNPVISYGPGDGTVNLKSLEICEKWKGAEVSVINGSNHGAVLMDKLFMKLLDGILSIS